MNGLYEELRLALHTVWMRRWFALAVAWALCLLGWLVVAMIPNSYESKARVFVQLQSLLPAKIGVSAGDQQREIDRVRQTLTSAVNLEKVVRGTALADTVASDRDVASRVAALQKQIKITAQQENLFEISATVSSGALSDADTAKLSRDIVQKLIDIFVEENLTGDRTQTRQTLEFLDGQLADRQRQLSEAERKRAEFEQRYMGLLPGEGSVMDRITAARRELSDIESQLVSAQSSLSSVNAQLATTPQTIATPGVGGVGPARARLSAIEGQLADARSKGWTDAHPDVVALNGQLAAARAAAAAEARSGTNYGSPNPMYLSLRSMQADRQAAVAAATARKTQLSADISQMLSRQAANPGVAAEMERIGRDYAVLKAQYDEMLADREEIRLRGRARSETDAVRFRVIDPPLAPAAPTAPNRPLFLIAVLVLGLGGGAAAAFGLGQLKSSFATAPRLAKATGLPVLGAITEVVTSAHRAARLKQLKLFAGGVGALGGACALLLVVEFVQRSLVA